MRNAIALALVLASTAASAQPVTRPCAVTIARAPDDVRIVVDAWVAAEPSCSTPLEVRIVPTEGGLYLLARDDQGRVRERIVPDAQSAGVLIASWAADDVMVAPAPGVAAAPPEPAPPPAPVGAPAPEPSAMPTAAPMIAPGGPGTMPPSSAPGAFADPVTGDVADGPPAPPQPRRISKWISAGGLVGDGDDGGLRVELDILTRGKWSFGVAGSATIAHTWVEGYNAGGQLTTADKKLTATVSRNMQRGRFQLRASAGLGFVYSDARAELYPYGQSPWAHDYAQGNTMTSVADASVLLGIELGKRWALTGGPVVTMFDQSYEVQPVQMSTPMTIQRQNVELMGYMGLRYRL